MTPQDQLHDLRSRLPQRECERKQLHPIQDSLYPRGQELYQICSIRAQRVLYWQTELDQVKEDENENDGKFREPVHKEPRLKKTKNVILCIYLLCQMMQEN